MTRGASLIDPLAPISAGRFDRDAARHLLRRAGFGPRPGQVERALERGLEATLGTLLEPPEHPGTLREDARHLLAAGRIEALQSWWMALILGDHDPLRERMTLAWHDHFATSSDKVDDVRLMHRQNEMLRDLALGDFRDLLQAVATDPAMLVWLDGNENRRGRPNENFARELMELFALGIGQYTERDVTEAARALTGWGTLGRGFHFRPEHHDGGTKRVFGRSGAFAGEQLLELVLEHPACPAWVARRLLAEFVTAKPADGDVRAVAELLVEQDWNVGRTLARLLRSELFFAPEHRRARIAGPVELVAFTIRATAAPTPPAEASRAAAEMGQALFRPPSVKGWDGGRSWIDAGTWVARHNFLARLAASHRAGRSGRGFDLTAACGEPADRAGIVAGLAGALLGESGWSADRTLLTTLEREALAAPDDDEALRRVALLLMTAPEYHLT